MSQFKKTLIYLFAAAMLLLLCACGSSSELAPSAPSPTEAPEVTPEPTPEVVWTENTEASMVRGVSRVMESSVGGIRVDVTSRGAESDITMTIDVTSDGKIESITVVEQEETAVIGGKALQDEYLSHYIGLDDPSSVDAYSGATLTSNAIQSALTSALNQYKSLNGLPFEEPESYEEKLDRCVKEYLGEEFTAEEVEGVDLVKAVYTSENGYAVVTEGVGHEPEHPMKVLVCIDPNGVVQNIDVLESYETEGIGSKVLAETNLVFYYGSKTFTMIDMGDATKIDIVSGATETSYSLMKMVNAATAQVRSMME